MSFYGFLRLGAAPVAMFAWVLYQLFFKRRRFQEMKGDFYAAVFYGGCLLSSNLLAHYLVSGLYTFEGNHI
jgi:hypothetical protein